MALINCPNCAKKISSLAKSCEHCQIELGGLDTEQRLNLERMKKIEESQKLMNQSMLAMVLFCAGIGGMFWGEPDPGSTQHNLATGSAVIGFVWYLVNRVRMIILKRK
ncbi:hypothetical protein [Thalassotalea mangrovi]|uniref:Zinc ribbon domain-containing protein n=1 Tax=Thalassotalea mangrovi TaxID=2572245 RepID=A0A4U1B2D5_9GAMM|nr:hypothetical protein [Thalassotalea mangrovi]TKB43727.1 hypothetical protein E8M12_13960 [Thalassotalea mangrovi]